MMSTKQEKVVLTVEILILWLLVFSTSIIFALLLWLDNKISRIWKDITSIRQQVEEWFIITID